MNKIIDKRLKIFINKRNNQATIILKRKQLQLLKKQPKVLIIKEGSIEF